MPKIIQNIDDCHIRRSLFWHIFVRETSLSLINSKYEPLAVVSKRGLWVGNHKGESSLQPAKES